jgi:itaconyl-CoA hydratase
MAVYQTVLGRFYEDFEEGDVYRHPLGRTVTETDNIWFTLLTMNTNPNHFDYRYAAQSEFGKPLVNSGLTVAIVLGLSVIDTSQQAFANLGWTDIEVPNPVFPGDTLYAESMVLAKQDSNSRPHGGIVTIKTRGLNQHGNVVVRWKRTFFVYRRGAADAESCFPEPESPIDGE